MRTSDYNIYIPLPDCSEYITIHGYSGAVDVARPEVVEFLQRFQQDDDLDDVPLNEETVSRLIERGYLTNKTLAEERAFVLALGKALHKRVRSYNSFLIIPTYNCNLRCPYCYEAKLRRKGRAWLETTITAEQVDAAYEAIARIQPDATHVRALTLYGGEPLLRENRTIVEYIVEEALERGYPVRAVTNGVDLDAFLDLLGPEKIVSLQITIDGPPELHDRRRRRVEGGGTFTEIVRNVSLALETGVHIQIRTNVDQDNLDHVAQLASIYGEQGWTNQENFRAYCHVVHKRASQPKGQTISLLQMVESLSQEHITVINSCSGIQSRFLHLLKKGKYPTFYPAYCGSNVGMYLLDPFGDIYVCWDFVGEEEGKVGTYIPQLQFDDDRLEQWLGRGVVSISECRECRYALLCGGGCSFHALDSCGSLFRPACDNFGEMLEVCVPRAYAHYKSMAPSAKDATI